MVMTSRQGIDTKDKARRAVRGTPQPGHYKQWCKVCGAREAQPDKVLCAGCDPEVG
jgi:hypothetical protein